MKFDIKLYDDTKCKPVFPNVSVVVVNFHNESIYDVVELTPVRKVRVFDFSGAEAEGKVVAHFKVMHPQSLRDREFLIRRTRIYNGEETVMNWLKATTNKTLVEWQIEARPERYRVVLEPVIHEKEEAYIKADPRNLTIQIDVKELAPTDAPTEVEVTELLDVVYVDFEPIPEEKIPGKDAGCEVRLCENPDLVESCEVKRLPPRSPTAEYRRLKPSTIYHVSVACMTGGGMGPRSPWITFTTGQLKKKSPKTTTTTVPTTTIAVSGVLVSIEASRGMNVILTLGFKMKDGSKFYDGFVRYLELLQYRRSSAASLPETTVITKDVSTREINLGLSPGYKFDLNCYSYAVNVTFQNNAREFKKTKERCYSFISPGFMIVYGVVLVLIALVITCFVISSRQKKIARQQVRQMDRSGETASAVSGVKPQRSRRTDKKRPRH